MAKKTVVPCIPNKVIEEFIVHEKNKIATITFVNGVFYICDFNFSGSYGYNDWCFLGRVAARIEKIKQQKERGDDT